MTQSPEPILFLSGAGLPAWIWEDTRQLLSPGESAVAPRPTRKNPILRDYARTALAAAPWESFAVVAHSAGGVVAAELLRLAPERVSSLLAVSAVVPAPGDSFIGSMPIPHRYFLSLVMRLMGTKPPDKAIAKTLSNRLDPATSARIQAEFTPESPHFYRDRMADFSIPQHRGYLHTSEDAEFPLQLQQRFAGRLQPNYTNTLATGHLPMLEDPQGTAQAIEAFLNGGEGRPGA
ncbi:alpha/beta fold hydrolase [Corynebacterium sp. A21]|uniref:alpha/beta fold hydrolase n=1 Tax=Corynebacterium sp. A21 TaxID=3457318 RepID=UPI003FD600D0